MGSDDRPDAVAHDTLADAGKSAAPVERGSTIGRYIVVARLGSGAMGDVFAAFDPDLDRKVALKLLRPDVHGSLGDSRGRTRILREAQALARLSHPNVVAVYDVGSIGERVFVAMELVDGETVSAWLARKPRTPRQILDVFVQAGRGLGAAHEKGIVHRDFKPDNVLIGSDGRVRVLDFGLARAAEHSDDAPPTQPFDDTAVDSGGGVLDSPLTRTGALLGTPLYMAPEQFLRLGVDARTDQFAFCVALWEALYGARPFTGKTLKSLMFEVTQGAVQKGPNDRQVPGWLRPILLRGLSRKPDDRFAGMTALLDVLSHDPALARRRWIYASLAVAVAGAAVAGATLARRQHAQLCAPRPSELAGVWDAARKREIADAFHATGKPFAEMAYAGVARAVDDWTQKWLAMRVDACEATRLRGEQSAELLDLRMQCLARQKQHLTATSDLLARADGSVVEHAVEAAGALPALDACANAVALRAEIQPPTVAARAEVDALRQRLAVINAKLVASLSPDDVERADALVSDARKLAYPPVEAEALLVVGKAWLRRGDAVVARRFFIDTVAVAERAHSDLVVAEALIELVYAVGYHLRQFDESLEWSKVAEAVSDRAHIDDRLRSYLRNNVGAVLMAKGDKRGAVVELRESLRLKQKFYGGRDNPDVAIGLMNVSLSLWEAERSPESLTLGNRALDVLARTVGEQHPFYGMELVNLGDILRLQGHAAESLVNCERGERTLALSLAPTHRFYVEALIDIGLAQIDLHEPKAAAKPLERAVALISQSSGDRDTRAEAGFALARALWDSAGDRDRAHRLAVAARDDYAALGDSETAHRGEVDDWLRRHR